MKKIFVPILILMIVIASILASGCTSGHSESANNQSAQEGNLPGTSVATSPVEVESDETVKSEHQSVSLADNFPEEVPLVDGVMWECAQLEENRFRVNIDSALESVSDVHAYYKSKLTEVTFEGYIDDTLDDPMAEIAGLTGDWKVSVIAVQYDNGPVVVTIIVKSKDA